MIMIFELIPIQLPAGLYHPQNYKLFASGASAERVRWMCGGGVEVLNFSVFNISSVKIFNLIY